MDLSEIRWQTIAKLYIYQTYTFILLTEVYDNMSELISVIIPAHNVENYIDKCLNSLINQTHKELEVIIIDDGSTDRTPAIADEWASRDERIVVIHNQSSSGHSLVRNAGLEVAKGDYIGFTDSDDYIHPEYFQRLLSLIKEYDADISLCHEIAFNEGDKEPEFTQKPDGDVHIEDHARYISHFMDPFTGPIGWSWNKLYKAESLKKIRYRSFLYEDLVLNSEYSNYVTKAVWTDDKMYAYRIRKGSITSAGTKNQALAAAQSFLATEDILKGNTEDFKKTYRIYILGKLANLSANARVKFGKEAAKESYDLFTKEYDSTDNISQKAGTSKMLRLFLARTLPGLYSHLASK